MEDLQILILFLNVLVGSVFIIIASINWFIDLSNVNIRYYTVYDLITLVIGSPLISICIVLNVLSKIIIKLYDLSELHKFLNYQPFK